MCCRRCWLKLPPRVTARPPTARYACKLHSDAQMSFEMHLAVCLSGGERVGGCSDVVNQRKPAEVICEAESSNAKTVLVSLLAIVSAATLRALYLPEKPYMARRR